MSKIKTCLLCNNAGSAKVLNNIEMYECSACDLTWRQDFDVSITHYEEKVIDFSEEKTKDRLKNSHDRIVTFKKYISLNNLCDIGCGEGIFLQALTEAGYKDVIGIEPSDMVSSYAQAHKLTIYKGTIEQAETILEGKQVSTISMFHLVEHLHNPISALSSLYRSLPLGGHLILETPDFHCYSFESSNYKHKLIYEEHLYYFSRKSLIRLLEKVGFKIMVIGRRDFNLTETSIDTLLMRLGLKEQPRVSQKNVQTGVSITSSSSNKKVEHFLKQIVRTVLVSLVTIFNRNDYLWVIAEKK